MNRESHLKKISRKLDAAFGPGGYERPLVGDLDCLQWQLSKFLEELGGTLDDNEDLSREDMTRFLSNVRFHLKDNLGGIFDDTVRGIDETIGPDLE